MALILAQLAVVSRLFLQEPPSAAQQAFAALYQKNPVQTDEGEPRITVGISEGQKEVLLSSHKHVLVTWWDDEGAHQHVLTSPTPLTVRLMHSTAARIQHIVPLGEDGPEPINEPRLARARLWQSRGLTVQWQHFGAMWALGAMPQDLRRARLVAHADDGAAAAALSARLMAEDDAISDNDVQLRRLPAGVLQFWAHANDGEGEPLLQKRAHNMVTFEPLPKDGDDAYLQVMQVPFAQGYAWAGRQNRRFRGKLHVALGPDGLLTVVNEVLLEPYLMGVVAQEMPPAAPKEALLAQAIAARSHVLEALGHRHLEKPYHFCAEQHCQVYGGQTAEDPRTTQAVASSVGQVVASSGRVVRTLFSADCGGRQESNDVPWPERADPQLRSRADNDNGTTGSWQQSCVLQDVLTSPEQLSASYCGKSGVKRPWRRTLDCALLRQAWGEHNKLYGPLIRLEPGPRGHSGRLLSLTLHGAKGAWTVHRELPIRKLLGGLPSAAFIVQQKEHALPCFGDGSMTPVDIVGTGWGHGVGLCQRGAMARARAGQSCNQILRHYYAETRIGQAYERSLARR